MSTHTKEQGLRVHHLTNLGGLIALAVSTWSLRICSWARCFRLPMDSRIAALSSVRHSRLRATKAGRTGKRKAGVEVLGASPGTPIDQPEPRARDARPRRCKVSERSSLITDRGGLGDQATRRTYRVISYYGD